VRLTTSRNEFAIFHHRAQDATFIANACSTVDRQWVRLWSRVLQRPNFLSAHVWWRSRGEHSQGMEHGSNTQLLQKMPW
jgi:hypothetical protein